MEQPTSLRELCALFVRLGATAFGGPAVHLSLMHREVVERRKWIDEQRFLDLLSATNLIPGPNSTEMALHIGWQRRGFWGLVTAGLSFIVPAMLITLGLAVIYVWYGRVPGVSSLLYGIKPVMLAVVLAAVASLAKKALPGTTEKVLAGIGMVASLVGVHELMVLFGIGVLVVLAARLRSEKESPKTVRADSEKESEKESESDSQRESEKGSKKESESDSESDSQNDSQNDSQGSLLPIFPSVPLALSASAKLVSLSSVFALFFKIGGVLYGSGYVLLAFLRADLVLRLGWLSESQLIDAIAVGQMTPGPVFTTATFVGYLLLGTWGALAATAGIFLPAFGLVAVSGPLIPRLRSLPSLGRFLDGVNVGSWALMVAVTLQLGKAALSDLPAVLVAVGSLLAILRFRTNSTFLLVAGALIGFLRHHWFEIGRFF